MSNPNPSPIPQVLCRLGVASALIVGVEGDEKLCAAASELIAANEELIIMIIMTNCSS